MNKKYFMIFFWFVSWTDISLGLNIDLKAPKVEIHLPFGFLTIGWNKQSTSVNDSEVRWRYKQILGKRYV